MHCQDIQDLLSAYIDGMLDPSVQDSVEKHLEHCPVCRQEEKDLKMIVGLVQDLPLLDPPSDFRQDLRARLEDFKGIRSGVGQRHARGRRLGVLAVAASLFLVFGVASAWQQFSYKMGTTSTALVENQETGSASQVKKDMLDSRVMSSPSGVTLSSESVAYSDGSSGLKTKSVLEDSGSSPVKREMTIQEVLPSKQEITQEVMSVKTVPDGNGVAARGAGAAPPSALQAQPPVKAVLDLKVDDKGIATREVFGIARRYGGVAAVLPDTGDKEIFLRVPGSQFEKVISDVGRAGKITREDYTGSGLSQLPPEVEQIELYGKGGQVQEKAMAPLMAGQSAPSADAGKVQEPSRLDSNVPMVTIRVRLE